MRYKRTIQWILAAFLALSLAGPVLGAAQASSDFSGGTYQKAPREGRKTRATYYSGAFGACGHSLTGNYAASKFYKCGQKILVKHNGRRVVVTIQDRCQCFMDMAKHAFAQLAPLSKGIITVRLYRRG